MPSPMLARIRGSARKPARLSPESRWEIYRLGLPRRLRGLDALDAREATL